jgi:hypothetical protein
VTPSVLVRLRHSIDLRDGTVGYLASRGRSVEDIADACEMSPTEVRAEMRRADAREGRCTLWCASATCQSYARGEAHGAILDRALALGWRHDLRARLLCPRCTR